ncbi:MAG: GTPase HflX [Candidatus Babeliales bacterium]
MSRKEPFITKDIHPKTLLVGIYTPFNKISNADYYFEEFLSLVKTAGLIYDETFFMKVREVDNNKFFTKGKMEELKKICGDHQYEQVIFSEILSPLQERNLEDILDCCIFDRTQLILHIFKNAAKTSEGKIQVEMAETEFLKTRIIGRGKEFSQQAGYIGNRGPGETAKEKLARSFEEKLRQARKHLETLARSREVQRKARLGSGIPLACIIGYTNSGKSSLLNIMTKSEVLAEDKLFATLDTSTRELYIDNKKVCLVSDTVGFISQLPHHLVAAFKSTLDELQYARILLHVVDISNPAWKSQITVVNDMLQELCINHPILYVFNKTDKLDQQALADIANELSPFQPHVMINTRSKKEIQPLLDYLKKYLTPVV